MCYFWFGGDLLLLYIIVYIVKYCLPKLLRLVVFFSVVWLFSYSFLYSQAQQLLLVLHYPHTSIHLITYLFGWYMKHSHGSQSLNYTKGRAQRSLADGLLFIFYINYLLMEVSLWMLFQSQVNAHYLISLLAYQIVWRRELQTQTKLWIHKGRYIQGFRQVYICMLMEIIFVFKMFFTQSLHSKPILP